MTDPYTPNTPPLIQGRLTRHPGIRRNSHPITESNGTAKNSATTSSELTEGKTQPPYESGPLNHDLAKLFQSIKARLLKVKTPQAKLPKLVETNWSKLNRLQI